MAVLVDCVGSAMVLVMWVLVMWVLTLWGS